MQTSPKKRGFSNGYWDVLLVLRITGLFHPYKVIKVGWIRPISRL